MDKIAELRAERDQQLTAIETAKARIAKIDAILDAYHLLVEENVLPESDIVEEEDVQTTEPESADTEGKVRLAIVGAGGGQFEISDIVKPTGYSRQTVRRVLNNWSEKGIVRIVEQGFRRKPTRYEWVQTE